MMEVSKFHGDSTKMDYSSLRDKIIECFGTQGVFALAMGLSERSISLKLNNNRYWTQLEMYKACEVLNIPLTEIHKYFYVRSAG